MNIRAVIGASIIILCVSGLMIWHHAEYGDLPFDHKLWVNDVNCKTESNTKRWRMRNAVIEKLSKPSVCLNEVRSELGLPDKAENGMDIYYLGMNSGYGIDEDELLIEYIDNMVKSIKTHQR